MCENQALLKYQEQQINRLWRIIYSLIALTLLLTLLVIGGIIFFIKEYEICSYEVNTDGGGNATFTYVGGNLNGEDKSNNH